MNNRAALMQPLMMRKDYGKTEDKDALMVKPVPIEDYDNVVLFKPKEEEIIEDYDTHRCNKGCFLCDR